MRHRRISSTIAVALAAGLISTNAVGDATDSASASGCEKSHGVQDAWLDARLEIAYLMNPHLNNFTINTDVDGGDVLLTGTVRSQIDRDLAEEIAKGFDHVKSVDNQLVVKEDVPAAQPNRSLGQSVNDVATTAHVKSRLLVSDHLSGSTIDVDTHGSTVTLTGIVQSAEERQLAGLIAKNTANVKEVTNKLEVASATR